MFRAVLKSLLARKIRLVLSGLAVVLGVMFVAGSLVLTTSLGESFSKLFATAYQNTDVQVSPKPAPGQNAASGPSGARGKTVPASVVDRLRSIDGVKSAQGDVMTNGTVPIGHDGKAIASSTGQQYGGNWTGTGSVVQLRAGHGPRAPDDVVVNAGLAKSGGFHVGDRIKAISNGHTNTFRIVGIYGYSGDRDSLGGETSMQFTTATAQRLLLGHTGVFSDVTVTARPGVSQQALADRISAELGASYQVQTGEQLAEKTTNSLKEGLKFLNYILLGFAGVALFVGAFLILNTFSIIVAQRTRELALMRAMGASRRQMIGSVLLEAVVIGVLAGALGLAAGVGVGAGLGYVFTHVGGGNLQLSIGVPASAVIASFAVGIVITVVAALFPSLRASRIPPVAAMRDAATPDRPLRRISVAGGVVFVGGAAVLALGLFGSLSGTATLWAILAGVLVAFIGVALLTPLIARPVVGAIGRLMSFSTPGKLGRRNSARNPRRTAVTAAALMVGIALITGVSTVLSSMQTSIDKLSNQQIKADLIVSGQQTSEVPPSFDPAILTKMRDVSGVSSVAGVYRTGGRVDGTTTQLSATDDVPALEKSLSIHRSAGSIARLGDHQAMVDAKTAKSRHVTVGDTVRVRLPRGGGDYTVSGIYSAGQGGMSGWVLPHAAVADFGLASPTSAYVTVSDAGSTKAVKKQVNALLADNPLITVADRSDYVQQQGSALDTVQTMIQILLTLAIIIAALGVVNTLALSVTISVFGAVLGLAVGAGLGAAVVRALHDQGITQLSFSWGLMVAYLILAAVIGVLAAILPSVRAARLNVLNAIAYE